MIEAPSKSTDKSLNFKILSLAIINQKWRLLMLLVLVIGLWQVAFYQNIMKWDIMDISLPWRYFVSECINNHQLPLWNPYINMGFPQMGDARTWYPIAWAFALFFGYNVKVLQLDFLLHVFIGGLGFFQLCKSKNLKTEIAFTLGVAYMLSGFIIGNAQHMGWIRSAAWLPFIFLMYYRFSSTFKLKDGLLLAILLFLLLSGGYEAYFITVVYMLIFISLAKILKNTEASRHRFNSSYKVILITLLFFLALSGIVLHSTFELAQYITRGKPLDFSNEGWGVLTGSLTPKSLISLLLPLGTSIDSKYWGNDVSMLNCYFGIVPLTFVIYGVLRPKREALPYLIAGIFFMMLALAEVFPFRKWLYLYLPYMNIFRFSTLFRLYSILFLLLGAGISLQDFSFNRTFKKETRLLLVWGLLTLIVVGFLLGNLWTVNPDPFYHLTNFSYSDFLEEANKNHRLLFNAFFALFILGLLFWAILVPKPGKFLSAIACIVILEMILSAQLNAYNTVVEPGISPSTVDAQLKKLPKGFPLPSLQHNMKDLHHKAEDLTYLWRNLGVFYKTPTLNGYTPYTLNIFQEAYEQNLIDPVAANPLLFFTKKTTQQPFLIDSVFQPQPNKNNITIHGFGPNEVRCKAKSAEATHLVLAQCNYPHWRAYVDGTRIEIEPVNEAFISISLPAGEHEVVFKFASPYAKKLFILSWGSLFLGALIIAAGSLGIFKIKI